MVTFAFNFLHCKLLPFGVSVLKTVFLKGCEYYSTITNFKFVLVTSSYFRLEWKSYFQKKLSTHEGFTHKG